MARVTQSRVSPRRKPERRRSRKRIRWQRSWSSGVFANLPPIAPMGSIAADREGQPR